jgi:hypothetical protein
MHLKPHLGLFLALFVFCATGRAAAQAAPAAAETRSPLAIGAGFSGYNPDYGHGHLLGGTLWIDYSPNRVPQLLRGIGIEAYGRDLNYGRSKSQPQNLREDVGGGGVFYSWPRFRNIRPYGKFEMGFGNADYEEIDSEGNVRRANQTRTVTTLGGGIELRAFRSVWVRIDYGHEFWPDFFFKNGHAVAQLNPQGFTVGAVYHFSGPHFR